MKVARAPMLRVLCSYKHSSSISHHTLPITFCAKLRVASRKQAEEAQIQGMAVNETLTGTAEPELVPPASSILTPVNGEAGISRTLSRKAGRS